MTVGRVLIFHIEQDNYAYRNRLTTMFNLLKSVKKIYSNACVPSIDAHILIQGVQEAPN